MTALKIQTETCTDVFADDTGRAITTSLIVAERFGKSHKNVLQDIKSLECSPEFRELNFQPSSYRSAQNKKMPAYNITRDGFTFLAMGYTGKDAARYKEAYINAFNELEKRSQPAIDMTDPVQLLQYYATKQMDMQKELEAAKPAIAFHETCQTAPDEMTLTEWSKTVSPHVRKTIDALKTKFIYYSGHSLVPYQQYITQGWFTLRYTQIPKTNGEMREVSKVRVTAKGMLKLHEWLLKNHPNLLRSED